MKLFSTLVLFTAFLLSTQADAITSASASKSRYAQLEELYWNSGTLPAIPQEEFWYTGRCYLKTSPDRAIGALFLGLNSSDEHGDFPGADPEEDPVSAYVIRSERPGDFDVLSSQQKETLLDIFYDLNPNEITADSTSLIVRADSLSHQVFYAREYTDPSGEHHYLIRGSSSGSTWSFCFTKAATFEFENDLGDEEESEEEPRPSVLAI